MENATALPIVFRHDTASVTEIYTHLLECSDQFIPPLSDRVDLDRYADKLHRHACCHEAWDAKLLVGLVAIYLPEPGVSQAAFISNVSVLAGYRGRSIAKQLMAIATTHARTAGVKKISLSVSRQNRPAIDLYHSIGYRQSECSDDEFTLCLDVGSSDVAKR